MAESTEGKLDLQLDLDLDPHPEDAQVGQSYSSRFKKPQKAWTSARPKPVLDRDYYGEDTDDLAYYIDWHGKHPRCTTPQLKPSLARAGAVLPPPEEWKIGHPMLQISTYGIPPTRPLPKEIYKSPWDDAAFEEVSVQANSLENQRNWERFQREEDPWCNRSVQSEMFGSHQDLSPRSLSMKVSPLVVAFISRENT